MRLLIDRVIFFLAITILLEMNLAHAQGSVQATFTSDITWTWQTFDPRSFPAKVTNDDDSALASKGYVKIGTIRASVNAKKKTKKTDSGITMQLQSAILKKAAEAGGDVVRFTKMDAMDFEYETDVSRIGKSDQAQCRSYGGLIVGTSIQVEKSGTYTTPRYMCEEWTVWIMVDEGTVWRYGSKLPAADIAARAPVVAPIAAEADAEQATLIKTIKAAGLPELGADINSSKMKTWLSSQGTPEFSNGYYNFKSDGVSLVFNDAHILTAMFLYAEGADGFRQYQGNLPYGLSFQSSRKEIESILGAPDRSGGEGVINYWTHYNSKGIGIEYNTKQTDDMNARMYYISISIVR
jgi:hypothetical protein